MGSLVTRTELIDALAESEREAYFKHMKSGTPPLSPEVNARLFGMYLMGKTLDQIQRTNKNFTLGMLVQAKLEGRWDERRIEYQNELLDNVKDRVKTTQLEAIHFVSDQLGVAHSQFQARLMRYLETGDEQALGGMGIQNMKQYRESIEMLLQLTGQDNVKKVQSQVTHTVKVEDKKPEDPPEKPKELPSPASLLKLLDNGDK